MISFLWFRHGLLWSVEVTFFGCQRHCFACASLELLLVPEQCKWHNWLVQTRDERYNCFDVNVDLGLHGLWYMLLRHKSKTMKKRIFVKTEMQAKVAVEWFLGWFKTFFYLGFSGSTTRTCQIQMTSLTGSKTWCTV